jgi:hypothetical protein
VYTPEDDIASVPSSYRRLRRSQSMFPHAGGGLTRHSEESEAQSLGPRDAHGATTSSPPPPLDTSQTKENIRPPRAPALRAPKSMSFLRGRHGRNSSINSYESGGTAQSTSFAQAPLRSKTSAFFGSKGRRGESGLRRTLRSSSSNAELPPQSSGIPLPLPKDSGLRNKARKASKTLKDKFKNLFSHNKGDEDTTFPDQHIKSHKNHAANGFNSFDNGLGTGSQYGNDNGGSLAAACDEQARLDFLGEATEGQAGDDKSRVTSWTNSGPNTLTSEQQRAWREWEKQRLSIIKENGAHCPSPSLRRKAIGQHILQSQESLLGQPIPPGPTVDSQRVYAALMQRLNETTQLAQIVEQERRDIAEQSETPLPSTKADFEEYQDNGAKPAPLLVRRVTSAGSSTVPYNELHDTGGVSEAVASAHQENNGVRPPVSLFPPTEDPWAGQDAQGRVISDRASAFFGSPDAHLFRTESPYRRALRKSMEEAEEEMHPKVYTDMRVISDCGTEIRRPQDVVDDYEYSESVYSCDEERRGDRATEAMTPIVESPNNASTLKDASMSKDPPVAYRPTGDRVNSSVSSVDWKTWLSANVAKLQPSPSPTRSAIEYALPSMPGTLGQGHVREWAQIESEQGTPPAYPQKHDTTLPVSPSTPTETDMAKNWPFGHRSSTLRRTPPQEGVLAQIENLPDRPVSQESLPFPNFGPPPAIPPRSPLRSSPYKSSLANAKSMSHLREGQVSESKPQEEGRSLAHIRSVNQLSYATNTSLGSPQTPATRSKGLKLQKKRSGFLYSPSVATPSPGLTAAVEKQFGPPAKQHAGTGEGKENKMTPAAKLFTPEAEVRSARSKMVDVFLSSRRKRMASGSDGTAAHDENAAFI